MPEAGALAPAFLCPDIAEMEASGVGGRILGYVLRHELLGKEA